MYGEGRGMCVLMGRSEECVDMYMCVCVCLDWDDTNDNAITRSCQKVMTGIL